MKAYKLLWALSAFAFLSIHGCGGSDQTKAPAETTDAPDADAPLPPPTTVSGALTFKMSEKDALIIIGTLDDPAKSSSIKKAFAEGLASGLDGVDSSDIVITKISISERRLEGRSLSDSSSLVVDYTIKVASAAAAPDVTAVDTAAVATATQTQLKEEAEIEVDVKELATPEAPVVDSACKTAFVSRVIWESEAGFNPREDQTKALALVIGGGLCEAWTAIAESCTTKEEFDKYKTSEEGPMSDFDNTEIPLMRACHPCGHGFLSIVWGPKSDERRALSSVGHSFAGLERRLGGHVLSDEQCVAVDAMLEDPGCTDEDIKKMEPEQGAGGKRSYLLNWIVSCGTCGKGWSKMYDMSRRARALSPSIGQLSDLGRRLGGHIMSDEKCAAVDDFDDECTEEGFQDMFIAYGMQSCKEELTDEEEDAKTDQEIEDYRENCEKEEVPTKAEWLGSTFKLYCGPCMHNYYKFAGDDSMGETPETFFTASTEQCAAVFEFEELCTQEEMAKWMSCGADGAGDNPCPTMAHMVNRYIEGNDIGGLSAQCPKA